jgi:lysine decarboxylase
MAAAMMKGKNGRRLFKESVGRALRFRQEMKALKEQSKSWFFDVWQPTDVSEEACWPLSAEKDWHGFKNIDDNHMFLDPVKVTVLTPGMSKDGKLEEVGIPASIVSKYLDENGIIVEKTGPYNMLFLFSIGIDKTKAMSLLRGLTDFKRAYDLNLKVKNMLPGLYSEAPEFYKEMRIQELAQGIHARMREHITPSRKKLKVTWKSAIWMTCSARSMPT